MVSPIRCTKCEDGPNIVFHGLFISVDAAKIAFPFIAVISHCRFILCNVLLLQNLFHRYQPKYLAPHITYLVFALLSISLHFVIFSLILQLISFEFYFYIFFTFMKAFVPQCITVYKIQSDFQLSYLVLYHCKALPTFLLNIL